MNIATMGSFVVAALALLMSVLSTVRNSTKQYAAEMAKMTTEMAKTNTEMREMSEDLKEIKVDFRRELAEIKASYRADHDKLTKMEISIEMLDKRVRETESAQKGG